MTWADGRERPRTFCCHHCEDTGWVLGLRCTREDPCSLCQPPKPFLYPHSFTRPCPCRATNADYQKKRDANRQYVQGRQEKKGRAAA